LHAWPPLLDSTGEKTAAAIKSTDLQLSQLVQSMLAYDLAFNGHVAAGNLGWVQRIQRHPL
jgi:hypothetical protein